MASADQLREPPDRAVGRQDPDERRRHHPLGSPSPPSDPAASSDPGRPYRDRQEPGRARLALGPLGERPSERTFATTPLAGGALSPTEKPQQGRANSPWPFCGPSY